MKRNNFRMLAYAGSVLNSQYFGRTILDISGMRLSEKLPAFAEHDRMRPAGVITNHFKETNRLFAEGYFLSNRDGQQVKNLLNEGYPWAASIGIWAEVVEKLGKGETATVNGGNFSGPGVVWRQSQVREISFVSIPADANTSVTQLAASAANMNRGSSMNFVDHVKKLIVEEKIPVAEAHRRARQLFPDAYKTYSMEFFSSLEGIEAFEIDGITEDDKVAERRVAKLLNKYLGQGKTFAEASKLISLEIPREWEKYNSKFKRHI